MSQKREKRAQQIAWNVDHSANAVIESTLLCGTETMEHVSEGMTKDVLWIPGALDLVQRIDQGVLVVGQISRVVPTAVNQLNHEGRVFASERYLVMKLDNSAGLGLSL